MANHYYFGKAYLSVVPEKYTEVVLEIINFVNNFRRNFNGELLGQTKFRTVPANDAIVFRFTSPEQYFYIKDFVKNNKTIVKLNTNTKKNTLNMSFPKYPLSIYKTPI